MSTLTQTTENNGQTYKTTGFLGGSDSFISWTGTVTDTIGSGYAGTYNGDGISDILFKESSGNYAD